MSSNTSVAQGALAAFFHDGGPSGLALRDPNDLEILPDRIQKGSTGVSRGSRWEPYVFGGERIRARPWHMAIEGTIRENDMPRGEPRAR